MAGGRVGWLASVGRVGWRACESAGVQVDTFVGVGFHLSKAG